MLTEQTVYIMKKRSWGEDLNAPGEKTKKKKVPDFSRTFLGWSDCPKSLEITGFQGFFHTQKQNIPREYINKKGSHTDCLFIVIPYKKSPIKQEKDACGSIFFCMGLN
jgi:hypothetical protein